MSVEGKEVGRCGPGLLVLVGIHRDDKGHDAEHLAEKVMGLRIFSDAQGKMNLSIYDFPHPGGGYEKEILLVSNFTVYGDAKSRRPSFTASAGAERARKLFEFLEDEFRMKAASVRTGEFGADMRVSLVNDGPVTIILDAGPGTPKTKQFPLASMEEREAVGRRLGVTLEDRHGYLAFEHEDEDG